MGYGCCWFLRVLIVLWMGWLLVWRCVDEFEVNVLFLMIVFLLMLDFVVVLGWIVMIEFFFWVCVEIVRFVFVKVLRVKLRNWCFMIRINFMLMWLVLSDFGLVILFLLIGSWIVIRIWWKCWWWIKFDFGWVNFV